MKGEGFPVGQHVSPGSLPGTPAQGSQLYQGDAATCGTEPDKYVAEHSWAASCIAQENAASHPTFVSARSLPALAELPTSGCASPQKSSLPGARQMGKDRAGHLHLQRCHPRVPAKICLFFQRRDAHTLVRNLMRAPVLKTCF